MKSGEVEGVKQVEIHYHRVSAPHLLKVRN